MKRAALLLLFISLTGSYSFSQIISLRGSWKFHIGDEKAWAATHFNDSGWDKIAVPSTWEDEGFNGYDGFAWYRIRFDGRKLNRKESYYLNLGYIDDADEAYLNGKLIGLSGWMPPKFKTAYNNERKYVLPAEVINYAGMNTLAVRVFDAMHGGGIVDGQIGIFKDENKKMLINLEGIWSFALSHRGEVIKDDSKWETIMVPAPWEKQGHTHYDGYGWYRRIITIPENIALQPLVLLLGKIDDFDTVYFNGIAIGSTNDHRPLGSSHSYQADRAYTIPASLIRKNGLNVIEVLVEDMGNIGGIYEGPIGIITLDKAGTKP